VQPPDNGGDFHPLAVVLPIGHLKQGNFRGIRQRRGSDHGYFRRRNNRREPAGVAGAFDFDEVAGFKIDANQSRTDKNSGGGILDIEAFLLVGQSDHGPQLDRIFPARLKGG